MYYHYNIHVNVQSNIKFVPLYTYYIHISSAKAHCADLPNVSYIVQASTQLEGRAEAVSRVCSSIEQSLILLGMWIL